MKNKLKSSLQVLFLAAFVALFAGGLPVIAQTESSGASSIVNHNNAHRSTSRRPRVVRVPGEPATADRATVPIPDRPDITRSNDSQSNANQTNDNRANAARRNKPDPVITVALPTGKGVFVANRQAGNAYQLSLGGKQFSIGGFR